MVEPTCALLNRLNTAGCGFKTIRMDNAGENQLLEKRANSADWKLNVKFEYTASRTPQQNSKVEVGFATVRKKALALMVAAHLPQDVRYKLYREAITCATLLDGLVVVSYNGKEA